MSITINLDPDKEALLQERAARRGWNTDEYLHDFVMERLGEPEPELPAGEASEQKPQRTLAEALAGHIGTQHSGRGDLSQHTGKSFTRLMVEKCGVT